MDSGSRHIPCGRWPNYAHIPTTCLGVTFENTDRNHIGLTLSGNSALAYRIASIMNSAPHALMKMNIVGTVLGQS
jgi:hypothetical protein